MNNYMYLAVKEAKKAYLKDEVPVGAIIIKDGKVIAKAHNKRQKHNLVTSHAEIIAITRASRKLKDWRLNGCIMYVTLEPCLMCRSIIMESRIDKVIYAVNNIKKDNVQKRSDIFEKTDENSVEVEEIIRKFFKGKRE